MRRNLVEAALNAASVALFEDAVYTHGEDDPVTVAKSIAGVEIVSERFEFYGQAMRDATHMTRALKAKFPLLTKGDGIDDGIAYRVVDWEPIGDGRLEIAIALKVA